MKKLFDYNNFHEKLPTTDPPCPFCGQPQSGCMHRYAEMRHVLSAYVEELEKYIEILEHEINVRDVQLAHRCQRIQSLYRLVETLSKRLDKLGK